MSTKCKPPHDPEPQTGCHHVSRPWRFLPRARQTLRVARNLLSLILFMLLPLGARAGATAVPIFLPPNEDPLAWETVLDVAGLEIGRPGEGPYIVVTDIGASWILLVRARDGTIQRVETSPPRQDEDREELAFLAASLLEPAKPPAAGPHPSPAPGPPAAPTRTPTSQRPTAAQPTAVASGTGTETEGEAEAASAEPAEPPRPATDGPPTTMAPRWTFGVATQHVAGGTLGSAMLAGIEASWRPSLAASIQADRSWSKLQDGPGDLRSTSLRAGLAWRGRGGDDFGLATGPGIRWQRFDAPAVPPARAATPHWGMWGEVGLFAVGGFAISANAHADVRLRPIQLFRTTGTIRVHPLSWTLGLRIAPEIRVIGSPIRTHVSTAGSLSLGDPPAEEP